MFADPIRVDNRQVFFINPIHAIDVAWYALSVCNESFVRQPANLRLLVCRVTVFFPLFLFFLRIVELLLAINQQETANRNKVRASSILNLGI